MSKGRFGQASQWILAPALLVCAYLPAISHASEADAKIQRIAKEMVLGVASDHPINATYLGIPGHDAELDHPSRAQQAKDLARIRDWRRQLDSISRAHISLNEKDDVLLLKARLTGMERSLTLYRAWDKDYSASSNDIVNAIYTQFQHLPMSGLEGATGRDVSRAWSDITARLSKAAEYIHAGQRLVTHPGHLYGVVGVEELEGAPSFLGGALTDAAKAQMDPGGFKKFAAARDTALGAIAATVRYIKANVGHWPENYAMGAPAYNAMLRDEQLLPFSASQIEQMGIDELGHGATWQSWLTDQARFKGTNIGPDTGGGIAPDGEALIGYYRDRIADLQAWMVERQIVTIPAWFGTVKVVETPKFMQPVSPGAAMDGPRLFAKENTGYYFITPPKSLAEAARTLDANEDFDRDRIWSTAAHEAMPGHFLQGSIAKRHHDFVRKTESSSSFAEGWAYYGEEMFVQLGMYGDDLDARYYTAEWERVRGCRAIVDAKLASGEWSYDKAVDFFAANSGFTREASKAAVAGIALGPGYVVAYTVGRLQIQKLATEYWRRMGAKGSLHDFHDRLLSYGTTALSIVGPELLADLSKPAAKVRAAAGY
jgi:uncharacterized protein (DUF885 family)